MTIYYSHPSLTYRYKHKKHSCIFNSITVDYNTIINGLLKITVQTKVRETKSWRLLNTPFTQYIFSLIVTSYTLALFYCHYIKMDINTTSFSKFFQLKRSTGMSLPANNIWLWGKKLTDTHTQINLHFTFLFFQVHL